MKIKKKTFLITGATGFIGSHIVKLLLKKKYTVYVLIKFTSIKKINKKRNLHIIYYKNFNEIKKKLKKHNFLNFIHCATYYSNSSNTESKIIHMINSNIVFGILVFMAVQNTIKTFINFGSMMEYDKYNIKKPLNFYGLTKKIYEEILDYSINKNKIKYYNIKLYDTYGPNDKRNKIIPKIIDNYYKNKITKINSENLQINIVSIEKILKFIDHILMNKLLPGSYCLLGSFIKIKKILENINKKLNKKIIVKYENNKKISQIKKKIKNLNYVYSNEDISKYILKTLK